MLASVVSDSVQPQRRQPTRLPCPWDSQGKNTGVGCHFLLQCIRVKSEKKKKEWKVKVKLLSRVQLSVTPWTLAHQDPPSMGFSRQEYWSGVPLPSLKILLCIANISVCIVFAFKELKLSKIDKRPDRCSSVYFYIIICVHVYMYI